MSYEVHALNHVLFSCSKYFMDVSGGGGGGGGFTMVTYIANIVSGYIVPSICICKKQSTHASTDKPYVHLH